MWSDTDIIQLLRFRNKSILASVLKAKHPFRKRAVPKPSGEKLLQLLDANGFEISAPQHPTHYSLAGNVDKLDIVARLSRVTVSDILDSDHLPTVFHTLDHVTTKQLVKSVEKFTGWERIQGLPT
jgi:hypothetical protein